MNKAWLVRPYPHGHDRINEFYNQSIIACGWPLIGSLKGKTREQIKQILAGPPYNYASLQLGNAYATIDIVANQMNIGDYVLIPHEDDMYFAKISSGYSYDASKDSDNEGYPHQRHVTWLSGPISRSRLSDGLRSSLKVHRTTADLSKHATEIIALAEGKEFLQDNNLKLDNDIDENNFLKVEYPLRPNVAVIVQIPKDISQAEASRLGDFIKTIYFM